jgi:hypothetical protein
MKISPPAFPTYLAENMALGMTLRDYFAAAIVAKLYDEEYISFDELAKSAYNMADAMMIARNK